MANNLRWTDKDLRDKNLVEQNGVFVPIDSVTNFKKVDKLPNLLERALEYNNDITNANLKMQIAMSNVPVKGNQKIKNAKKIEAHGLHFDSYLEKYMWELFTFAGIRFLYQHKFVLIDSFKYGKESVRPMTLTIDFYLPDSRLLCDTKGFQTIDNKLKWKLLKFKLAKKYGAMAPAIEMPSNKKKCDELIARIKAGEFL